MTRLTPQEIGNEIDKTDLSSEEQSDPICDHSFDYIKDIQGDGKDVSFWRCVFCQVEMYNNPFNLERK